MKAILNLYLLTGENFYRQEFERKQDRKLFHCKVGRKEAIEKFKLLIENKQEA